MHVGCRGDLEVDWLNALFEAFGLEQHTNGPTHIDGHTLDLVVSRTTDDIVQTCRVGDFLSDHNIIHIL